MARDYKNSGRGRASAKKRSGSSPALMLMVGLLSGLVIGVVVGLSVVATRTYVELRQELGRQMAVRAEGGPSVADEGTGKADRPRFEFYRILPEMEVVVPEDEARSLAAPSPPPAQPAAPAQPPAPTAPGRYLLQVASFQNHGDADRLKAQLALLGVQANIQTVEIRGGQTWHRVRVGPFSDNNELGSVRKRLQANGIESVLLKLSG